MNEKERTLAAYEMYPARFDARFALAMRDEQALLDDFSARLPPHARILDVGSGSGHQAAYLQGTGQRVVCIDNSPVMVALCAKRGLDARHMDFEELTFPPQRFEGMIALTSLLHIPKARFPLVLRQLAARLIPEGSLYLCMKEGAGEGFVEHPDYPGADRFFALYSEAELQEHIKQLFTIERAQRIVRENTFLNYFLRLK